MTDCIVGEWNRRDEAAMWAEYDMAADWCAARRITGNVGDPLPANMGADTIDEINADPEAFQRRIRESAYALAMNKHNLPEA